MKEIQRTLKNYILKRLDTKTGIRSSKDIPELIYAYIELENAQQAMDNKPEVKSKIEVDKAGVKIQGKKINVNQNCQEAQIKEEPCDAKAQLVDILINKNEGKKEDAIDKILQMHSYEFLRRYFSKGLKKFND